MYILIPKHSVVYGENWNSLYKMDRILKEKKEKEKRIASSDYTDDVFVLFCGVSVIAVLEKSVVQTRQLLKSAEHTYFVSALFRCPYHRPLNPCE